MKPASIAVRIFNNNNNNNNMEERVEGTCIAFSPKDSVKLRLLSRSKPSLERF